MDRWTILQTDRKIDKWIDVDGQKNRLRDRQMNKQTDREIDK